MVIPYYYKLKLLWELLCQQYNNNNKLFIKVVYTCVNTPISKVSLAFAMPGAIDPFSSIIDSMILVVVEVIDGSLTMRNS